MATNSSLGSRIVAREILIQNLLAKATLVGGIYTMGYDECFVITNDIWKKKAGGIPQHCFLLATASAQGEIPDSEDEEIILLRVNGPAPLPAESELVQVREQAMREMVVTRGSDVASAPPAVLDVLTRNEIQFSALKAKILGTFYEKTVSGRSILVFGSDVETFYSSSRYKVYKPYGDSLSIIASYPEMTEQEASSQGESANLFPRVRLGTIRYSSSNRRQQTNTGGEMNISVPVRVNVQDFVAMKTAVFGMTRLGKSNTMKTIATAVFQYSMESGQRIGQLLFDPAGEYANINVQDQTALSQIGSEYVTIFRYGADGTEPGIRPLTSNFFSDDTIEVTQRIISLSLSFRTADYIQSFLSADVIGPENMTDNPSAYNRARRRRSALYATLVKAGFQLPRNFSTYIMANADVINAVNQQLPAGASQYQTNRGSLRLNSANIIGFWDALLAARDNGANIGDWIDNQLEAILAFYRGTVGSGYRLLEPLRVYHSPSTTSDYAQDVLTELIAGKIVIIDLSLGSETILQFCSERIITFILRDAARRFAEGQEPNQIQIFIEEAHRLFNRDRMKMREDADPYVRLAKEAAKYRLGLIYATQEVSSVDSLILSNTSNWIVTHLNNHVEVKELSKYYDFQDFSELTMKAEDVGFARLKTRSGRYIIPVQVDLFDQSRIDAAKQSIPSTVTSAREEA